jgi:hypothetical protein
MGKAYYKGGFEKQMNRREAALILETSYASTAEPEARVVQVRVID